MMKPLLLTLAILLAIPTFSTGLPERSDGGDGVLHLFNTHTGEFKVIKYKEGDRYLTDGLEEVERFLSCRLTGDSGNISLGLLELVDRIEDHFSIHQIDVISGYRSPELNSALRRRSKRVARESLHMKGLAIDIKPKGVPLRVVRDFAKSLGLGGVGYYGNRFVHVDVGPVRYW